MISGTVQIPGSKSLTHRAYLLGAHSDRPCTVAEPLRSADTDATLACLHRLGHRFERDDRTVTFQPSAARPPTEPLDCANAGTGLRLLLATAARHPFPITLTGDASLQSRPNAPLVAALRSLGARVSSDDHAPFTVQGPVVPGTAQLPANTSSQYASALLLALPMLAGPSVLTMAPPVSSRPYIDVTLGIASEFGLRIEADEHTFRIPGSDVPRADAHRVEADWSTAAFPLLAAAITGGNVRVEGLRLGSAQGDRRVVDHLQSFGCKVQVGDNAVTLDGTSLETPGTIDVAATPDMFPALCIAAACATGTTTFTGGAALRHKESDRITAMANGLTSLGIRVEKRPDGMVVHGGTLTGGSVHAFDDHRIHMAFTIAGLAANGEVFVDGAESAAVSYPNFHADLERLVEGGQ